MKNHVPPWQDKATLSENICMSERGIDAWVEQGILPPPRKRGGKLMWKWDEVDEYLTNGGSAPTDKATEIRNAARRIATEGRANY